MTDPALTAALAADGVWLFGAVKIELPGKTLRLLDGSAVMTIGGETYAGSDADFGTLAAIDVISEDQEDEAPELQFSFFPSDAASLATLANPAMQGATVTVMVGAANIATMTPIGTPEIVFLGEVDVATMRSGEGQRMVEFTVVSVFERLFEVDEGQRATDGFHQSIWPGEKGLDGMTGTAQKLYWGAKPPSGSGGTAGAAGVSAARFPRSPIDWGRTARV